MKSRSNTTRPTKNRARRIAPATAAARDRRRTGEPFHRAHEYAEALVETVREGLVALDSDLRIRTANPAFYETLGTTAMRAEGKALADLGRWKAPDLDSRLRSVFEQNGTIRDLEVNFAAGGDGDRTLVVNAKRVRLPTEPQPLLVLAIEDVTERRGAAKRLRESEHKYRQIFEAAREGILLVDEESSEVLDANPFLLKLLGASREEIVGRKFQKTSLLWHSNLPQEAWSLPGAEGSLQLREIELRSAAGRSIWVHRVVSRYEADGRTILQWNLRDITESRLLNQELLQSQKLESLGSLTAGIAHDFNNILAIVSSYSEKLQRESEDTGGDDAAIRAIQSAVGRGADLVRQLLAFGRKGEREAFSPLDINSIVRDLAKVVRGTFPKRIELELDLGEHLPPVEGDANQLQQMLLNLSVNARDAIQGKGKLVIETSAGPRSRIVSIAVSDDGHGMDEETRQRIFEPFFTTKKDQGGSGLGLSVVYGIVSGHGGQIDVESHDGRGATFRIDLPASQRPLAEVDHLTSPTAGPRPAKKGRESSETILVVEDEPLLLESLRELLEAEGFRVLTACNGIEALRIYESEQEVSVVFSDLGMPELGGLPTFDRLRQVNPSVKIILASGFVERHDREKMAEQGVQAFLSKPYKAEEILRTIREVLGG